MELQPPVRLSIVTPTLNEDRSLEALFQDLTQLRVAHEVIVIDGGSTDATRVVAERHGARVLSTRPGRGAQLALGARAAAGDLLCFLHADVRLPDRARSALEREARIRPIGAAVFRLAIDAPGIAFRIIERGANLRTRLLGLPYGDQGLVVSRDEYRAVGGYQAIPIMEDVALVRALSRRRPVRILDAELLVSARRWQRDGVWRRTLSNSCLIAAYLAGIPPRTLARWYRPSGDVERAAAGG
jgi:rSAM/selenodomain-associated transferase 2